MRKLEGGWGRRLGAAGRLARSVGRAAVDRVRGAEDAEARVAEALAEDLDRLKGYSMKVGQILSYLEVAPPAFAAGLARLQEGARGLEPDVVEEVLRGTFGARSSELFERFDPVPVAAASVGQVHRARFEGREVAVKVQYPGIAELLAGDTATLRRIGRLASLGASVDGVAFVDELRMRAEEECDYLREAASQEDFRAWWADDPEVRVPKVVRSRTARTVLTTVWEDGEPFSALNDASDERRRAASEVLIRFAYGSLFGHRAIQADPHPGNTRFAQHHVVFLDYGCVRRFSEREVEDVRRLTRVIVDGERAAFADALRDAGVVTRFDRFDVERHWVWMRELHRPFWAERFAFDRAWMAGLVKEAGPSNPNGRWLAWPPGWLWILRLQWGLAAVLASLGATGDFRRPFRQGFDRAG